MKKYGTNKRECEVKLTKSKEGDTSHEVTYDMPSSSRGNRAFEAAASKFSSKNPCFKVQLWKSCCHNLVGYMYNIYNMYKIFHYLILFKFIA